MLPLLLAMPFGPFLAWKRGDLAGALQRLFAAGACGPRRARHRAFALFWRGPWLAPFGIALGVWVVAGALSRMGSAREAVRAPAATKSAPRPRLPRSAYGAMLAHAGIGLSVIGIVATTAWQSESVVAMKPGDRTEIAGYELTFRGVAPAQGPNYQEQVGLFAVTRGGAAVTELSPSKRIYDAPRQATTEAAIHVALAGDLYVVLGDELKDGSGCVVRLYFNPLVRLIWLGALVMALGGALSLSDRRLRVGAPRRARRRCHRPRRSDARCLKRRTFTPETSSRRRPGPSAACGAAARSSAALLALLFALSPAHAVEPGEMLKDPALEARARRISQELRCLVCQNQSIDDSNAELARDLRVLVRERLAAGDSDARCSPSSRPATASSCCCARRSSCTRCCCGSPRSCCSSDRRLPLSAAPASGARKPAAPTNSRRQLTSTLSSSASTRSLETARQREMLRPELRSWSAASSCARPWSARPRRCRPAASAAPCVASPVTGRPCGLLVRLDGRAQLGAVGAVARAGEQLPRHSARLQLAHLRGARQERRACGTPRAWRRTQPR